MLFHSDVSVKPGRPSLQTLDYEEMFFFPPRDWMQVAETTTVCSLILCDGSLP